MEGLSQAFSTVGIMAALYSRGPKRAFWICAAAPATLATYLLLIIVTADMNADSFEELPDDMERTAKWMRVTFPILWTFSLMNGLIGAVAYRLVGPRAQNAADTSENQISK